MLLTMHIKNIALIEEIDIDFHEQLNIHWISGNLSGR